ncbi:MAG TPA: hypothetical protein VH852_02435 [Hyphomicrobium sp.]|jgi:hypothetical protein
MQVVFEFNHAVWRGVCAALLVAAAVPVAQANWLARLAREAGEAGSGAATRVGRYGVAGLDRAAAHIKALPVATKGAALAAHVTPEGHWKFVNREGEVFTAGTPDELTRAVPTLLPDAPSGQRLALYLTEDTVFGERALLKDLPEGAALHVVVGRDSYPLRRASASGAVLFSEVRPHLRVALEEAALFEEAVAQLERPLSHSSIRTIALEPGGPRALSSSPRLEPSTKAALVDRIDPGELAGALRSVRGQTVLVTGRIEDNLLHFRPESGPEQSLKVLDVIRAAEDADVNLVILHAPVPRQPGGRNWLWQRIAVDGLDDALKRATLGDFLDAIAASRGAFQVNVAREGSGRVVIRAVPEGSAAEPITGVVGEWLSSAASSITGNVVTAAMEVYARDEARQQELDRRIVPFIPSDYQFAYIVALVAGLMGWPVARGWWERLWPAERRLEYGGAVGYRAAQAARLTAFLMLFLPLVGLPALLVALILQLYAIVTLPFRFLRWIVSGLVAKAG